MAALYALVSPGGSPGVTTTSLALALTWPRPVIVAECDPACGDILAGLFAGHLTAPRGLMGVAFEAGQAPGLAAAWPAIARALASHSADVIADCGRLDAGDGQPAGVLTEATAVVMVLRPSLRQVAAARPRIELATQLLGGTERIGLLIVGNRRHADTDRDHPAKEIASALGVPVIGSLPVDAKTAAVLSDGQGRRGGLARRPLMRAAKTAGLAIGQAGPHAATRHLDQGLGAGIGFGSGRDYAVDVVAGNQA